MIRKLRPGLAISTERKERPRGPSHMDPTRQKTLCISNKKRKSTWRVVFSTNLMLICVNDDGSAGGVASPVRSRANRATQMPDAVETFRVLGGNYCASRLVEAGRSTSPTSSTPQSTDRSLPRSLRESHPHRPAYTGIAPVGPSYAPACLFPLQTPTAGHQA